MKKVIFVFILLLVAAGLLAGCSSKDIPGTNSTSAQALTAIEPLEKALQLGDDDLVNKYCSGVDLCLGDSLLFADSKTISSETLFTFFCYITSLQEEYGGEYGADYQDKKYYHKSDDEYHVPVADIIDVLNRYFDDINFDLTQINGYQAKTKEIVVGSLGGFGGGRFPKLVKKEQLNNDTLKLTVDYYDDQYKTVFYTKAYTIRFSDKGYKYLSIKKEV